MKVGVDARLLSRPITGIGRYTLEMCRALSAIDGLTLYLYSPAPFLSDLVIGMKADKIRAGKWSTGLLRQFWSESYLPLWAKKDELDVFWGPAHRLPHWLPGNMARVVTIHDLVWKYAGDTMRPLSRLLEKSQMPFAVKNADHVIADSRSTADAIVHEFTMTPEKLTVITPGTTCIPRVADTDRLHEMGINRPYFLFVGTLEPRKNLARLLEAYASLPEHTKSQAVLVIAGGKGWGGIELKEIINRLGLDQHVKLPGYVDEPTLSALYANARFLAMPSLYEGFGLPLVEAMVYGTPVLTANNSSMPEVAGEAGLLVDADSVESIATGLNQLITNDTLLNKYAENAKSRAARFSWADSARQLVTVFENAIDTRAARSL